MRSARLSILVDIDILPPDLKFFADETVASGRYRDVAEVMWAGVALLRRTEADDLRRAWQAGVDSGDAGRLDWAELRAAACMESAATRRG